MIDSLQEYTEWLMQRAGDAFRKLPAGVFTMSTTFANGRGLGLRCLRDTLLHMAMIEQRWVGVRLLGQPFRPSKEEFPPLNYPNVDSVMQVWRAGRALTTQWLSGHTADLDVPREVTGIFGKAPIRCTPRDLLLHAFTHTTGHRSDLTSQFSYHGIDPPALDYIIYVADKTR